MATQFIGEIRVFAFGATPAGWLICDGRLLQISQYSPLFSILGIRFGGDGNSNFGLPNLNGRAPLGGGTGSGLTERKLGDRLGDEKFALFSNHYPAHNHEVYGMRSAATQQSGTGNMFTYSRTGSGAKMAPAKGYNADAEHLVKFGEKMLSEYKPTETEHNNMQPYLALRLCIACDGVYPPRPGEEAAGK